VRKRSFYSIDLLLWPGNTLSAFQRLVSHGCSYLSSSDLPHNSSIKVSAPDIRSSGSMCQPVLSGCIVAVLFGAWCCGHYGFGLWSVAGQLSAKGNEVSSQLYPSVFLECSVILRRVVSHWCCLTSADAGFRAAKHLSVFGGGENTVLVSRCCHGPQQVAD